MLAMLVVLMLAASPTIQPKYQCRGDTPQGRYNLPLQIQNKGDNYFLFWGNGEMQGIGFRKENRLSVAFVNLINNGVGVIVYEIKDDSMQGYWAGGDGRIYQESCSIGLKAGKEKEDVGREVRMV